jgi:hypothetical protein
MRGKRETRKRLLIGIVFQAVVGLISFRPVVRLATRHGVSRSEIVIFYSVEWLIAVSYFLGDMFSSSDKNDMRQR